MFFDHRIFPPPATRLYWRVEGKTRELRQKTTHEKSTTDHSDSDRRRRRGLGPAQHSSLAGMPPAPSQSPSPTSMSPSSPSRNAVPQSAGPHESAGHPSALSHTRRARNDQRRRPKRDGPLSTTQGNGASEPTSASDIVSSIIARDTRPGGHSRQRPAPAPRRSCAAEKALRGSHRAQATQQRPAGDGAVIPD